MPRIDALLLRRFIQANPSQYVSQIVIDIDRADAELRAFALHESGLIPNMFATKPSAVRSFWSVSGEPGQVTGKW